MTDTASKTTAGWQLWLASFGATGSRAVPATAGAAQTALARIATSTSTRIAAIAVVTIAGLVALAWPPSSAGASPTSVNDHASAARVHAELAPATLAQTGLYADWATKTIAPGILPFAPQYPLWSDGASKQRWIYLPAAIDARGAWAFPIGTKIWKEFSFGARTETRYMERTPAGWIYATYVWSGDTAVRAPAAGATVPIANGTHRIPSDADCRACHGNASTPVLGFSALQLSSDRDPRAPHRERGGVDLVSLAIAGFIVGLDDIAPRISGSPVQRAALGYLHGNCGGCHRAEGPLGGLGLVLADGDRVLGTTAGVRSRFDASPRVVAGDAGSSLLVTRMAARRTPAQMPPIGTDVVDAEALRLVADWIDQLAPTTH